MTTTGGETVNLLYYGDNLRILPLFLYSVVALALVALLTKAPPCEVDE